MYVTIPKGGDTMNKTMKLLLCLVGVLALLQVTLTKGHTEEAAAPEAADAAAIEADAAATEAAAEATDDVAAEAIEVADAEAIEAAAEATETAAAEDAEAAEEGAIELAGTIASIEADTSTIIIEYAAEGAEAASSTAPFKVTEETAITSEEMPLALSDLKAGDQVNAIFSLDAEGTKVLQAILVRK